MAEVLEIEAYRCEGCGELYEDSWDAEACCSPTLIDAYQCQSCLVIHDDETVARKCCKDERND